jgi:ABC-type cobalamin transport system ATPase subunit
VRIATQGAKGATQKVLVLDVAEGVRAKPEHVFSEGEKRAVVLADFLTEVTLNPASAGIILDDPVTSLDAEWKRTIAAVLVEEARNRQVIVFTHDLHFLYVLRTAAEGAEVNTSAHWVQRGVRDDIPGFHGDTQTSCAAGSSRGVRRVGRRESAGRWRHGRK